MSPLTHTTAVVLIPPEQAWEPIQAIRRKHDRQVRRWMPHVTILYPFRPQEEFAALAEGFSGALRGVAPFEVRLAEFRHFRHGPTSFTVYLTPEPSQPILDLQRVLLSITPDCDDTSRHPGGFHPHLSVGQFRGSQEALRELLDSLRSTWSPLNFQAREVSLIWRGEPPDDVFRVGRKVGLG